MKATMRDEAVGARRMGRPLGPCRVVVAAGWLIGKLVW